METYPKLLRYLSCRPKYAAIENKTFLANAKSFDSIPGPKSIPIFGTLWKYLPLVGEYKFDQLHKNGLRKLQQYGPLVREDIIPNVSIVWVFTPADIEKIYQIEGRHPERRSHLALQKYRKDRPHLYKSGGLLPTNGEEWWQLRSKLQRSLSRVQDVRLYLEATNTIVKEFIDYAVDSSQPKDFLPKLSRLYLELTCMIAFCARLNSFSPEEQSADSHTSQLILAAETTNSCILRTDNGPQLWRHFRTPLYRKLESALKTLETTAVQMVNMIQDKNIEETSLVAQYLECEDLDVRDVYGMAVDLILAGIDTTTYTTCFALYHLATNPEAQNQLYKEARQVLASSSDKILPQSLASAAFTRAVIKETFRLNPVSVGVGRILPEDTTLSGFRVPAGTVVVTQNQVTCQLEEWFPRAGEFVPYRWLKESPEYQAVNPYLVLPFGHGPRSCIARRLAEQNLQVFLLRLVHDFELSWHGGQLGVRSLLINKPDQPVLLGFKKRGH